MPDSPLIVASLPMLGTAVSRRRVLQGTGVTALAALLSACSDSSSTSGDGSATAMRPPRRSTCSRSDSPHR